MVENTGQELPPTKPPRTGQDLKREFARRSVPTPGGKVVGGYEAQQGAKVKLANANFLKKAAGVLGKDLRTVEQMNRDDLKRALHSKGSLLADQL